MKNKTTEKQKSEKILALEKEVALGLWVQVIGQLIEIKGLSGLLYAEDQTDSIGEQQVLAAVWIRTIGQILEAVSVSSQINETDVNRLQQEQKLAITGDLLTAIGAAYEVAGGVRVLEEEAVTARSRIIP
ncbi:hypothetical protein ACP2W0_17405 [Pseudobacillus badius]|uniref:hypothetical protein n=1 Tax=Bacillus badius TaxID=1455 RepID=UPI0007B0521D|nr:hypothetical protein [Bacillus badius]KZN99083.1 hypothetical protein A4244_08295 [Bacillus badius]OCS84021.1 hypothetical protein A6M11_08310 [Bacillus badius]OVE52684.1 hypothetical protein B1A98_03535 [Bacillus badius]TDW04699.1 hypothetical protein B0G66_102126 [Bacillus badius]UAT29141.1 hypothetical protein K7T73_10965 [Bacillus badius]